MTDIVKRLRSEQHDCCNDNLRCNGDLMEEAADEIERLREKCDKQARILRHLTPENFSDTLFIHSTVGKRDINNMPEKLLVVPSYGCDFSYVYERTEKTTGPGW